MRIIPGKGLLTFSDICLHEGPSSHNAVGRAQQVEPFPYMPTWAWSDYVDTRLRHCDEDAMKYRTIYDRQFIGETIEIVRERMRPSSHKFPRNRASMGRLSNCE